MIINIRKSDNQVVDVEQTYDIRFFDNATFSDGTIPAKDNPRKYFRNIGGQIVKRPRADLDRDFLDERKSGLVARIDALPATVDPQLKQILKDLIK